MPDTTVSPSMPTDRLPPEWQARLERAGLRRTQATRRVLELFLHDSGWSPTHAEVDAALQAGGLRVNRVTLYRLLDRLAAAGLLERQPDDESRSWRFHLAASDAEAQAPRFECDACHRQFRITEASQSSRAATHQLLDALAHLGHHAQRVELAIHGTCAGCQPNPGQPARR